MDAYKPGPSAVLSLLIPGVGQIYNGDFLRGLFWLIVAKDSARADEGWITDTYGAAFAQATDEERALAYKYLENWVKRRASPAAAARE